MRWHRVLILAVYLFTLQCDYSETCPNLSSNSLKITLPSGANVIAPLNAALTYTISSQTQDAPVSNKCENYQSSTGMCRSSCRCRQQNFNTCSTTLSAPLYKYVPTTTTIMIQVQNSSNSSESNTTTNTTSTCNNEVTDPTNNTVPATTDSTTTDQTSDTGTDQAADTCTDQTADTGTTSSTDQTPKNGTTSSTDPAPNNSAMSNTDASPNTNSTSTNTTPSKSDSTNNSSTVPKKRKGRKIKSRRRKTESPNASSSSYSSSHSETASGQSDAQTEGTATDQPASSTESSRKRRSTTESSAPESEPENSNTEPPTKQTKNSDIDSECSSLPQITITKYTDNSTSIDIVELSEKSIYIGNGVLVTVVYILIQAISIKAGRVNATSIDQSEVYVLDDLEDTGLITTVCNNTDTKNHNWKYVIDKSTVLIASKNTICTDYLDNFIDGHSSSKLNVTLCDPDGNEAHVETNSSSRVEVDTTDFEDYEDQDNC